AAVTSKVSSNCFTNSESSIRVISLKASRSSSVLSFAMISSLLFRSVRCLVGVGSCGCLVGCLGLCTLGVRLLGLLASPADERRVGRGRLDQRRLQTGRLRQRGHERPGRLRLG